jgi:iron(III) transport system substrate-binding protein
MSLLRTVAAGLLAFLAAGALPSAIAAVSTDDVVAGARKEGEIEFYAPSTLTPQGAQALGDAFNRRHKLDIKFHYNPSGSMGKDIARVVTRMTATIAPEWDLMMTTDAHHATLWLRKLHQPFNYAQLGVGQNVIHYDSGTVSVSNQLALPAYNPKLLSPKDTPKRWEDLLDPKWKGGNLGVTVATHHFARLAKAWGEEKATRFVKDLAKQAPSIGEIGIVYSRLLLGEFALAATLTDSYVNRGKKSGAPVAFVENIQPIISSAYHVGVVKNALHPNVGYLFAAFLATIEAQQILEKFTGQSSVFVPGTPYYKYAQGKQLLHMTQDDAKTVDRLRAEYYKILGFGN